MPKIAMLFVTTTDIPIGDALVEVRLTRSDFDDKISGVLMNRLETFRTEADGSLLVDLMTCKALYHVTVYDTVQDIAIHHDFYVPEDADPTTILRLQDLIVPPDTYLSTMPFDETAMLAIIDARNVARESALQAQASAVIAVDAAVSAQAAIDNVQANADKVETWTAEVEANHTDVEGWAAQVALDKTHVDAVASEVDQDKDEAVNAAANALASKNSATNSAAAALADATAANASKVAAAASATSASASAVTTTADRTAVAADKVSVKTWRDEVEANKTTVAANTATTLGYKDQAYQYMLNAQTASGSATASATAAGTSATNAGNSATSAFSSAGTATTARDVAVDAKNKAETAWTDFDKRYFGAYAANPATNTHGAAPAAGSMYWNIPLRQLNVFENGVWTPLPFTSTEVPLASALVRTQANGYINTAMLDSAIPLVTQFPVAMGAGTTNKYGYSYLQGGQGQRLYKIASLPANGSGTYAMLRIDALVGGWDAVSSNPMSMSMGSRSVDFFDVDWSAVRGVNTNVRFVAYKEADNSISVYLFFQAGAFAQACFQIMGQQATTYTSPVAVDTAPGTLVWDSGASAGTAGYKSPRSRGMGVGAAGTSFDTLVEVRARGGDSNATTYIAGAALPDTTAVGVDVETVRMGVAGNAGVNSAGYMNWSLSAGTGNSTKDGYLLSLKARDVTTGTVTGRLFSVSGLGDVTALRRMVGSRLTVGPIAATGNENSISGIAQSQGEVNLRVPGSASFFVTVGVAGSATACALNVGRDSNTGRSINAGGTINTSGADYAEYIRKCLGCADIPKGAVIGITANNEITDKFADAVMFAIKSTDPSFVGGDVWSVHVGDRPVSTVGAEPTYPVRIPDELVEQEYDTIPTEYIELVIKAGDTDEEWATKLANYNTMMQEWEAARLADEIVMAEFDAKLEQARQQVDRIAIAGRVPVNVLGAQPGDYIVPVQDGEGIKGVAVKEDDMTLRQYLRSIGQVITIEADGRAYVMVKAV